MRSVINRQQLLYNITYSKAGHQYNMGGEPSLQKGLTPSGELLITEECTFSNTGGASVPILLPCGVDERVSYQILFHDHHIMYYDGSNSFTI